MLLKRLWDGQGHRARRSYSFFFRCDDDAPNKKADAVCGRGGRPGRAGHTAWAQMAWILDGPSRFAFWRRGRAISNRPRSSSSGPHDASSIERVCAHHHPRRRKKKRRLLLSQQRAPWAWNPLNGGESLLLQRRQHDAARILMSRSRGRLCRGGAWPAHACARLWRCWGGHSFLFSLAHVRRVEGAGPPARAWGRVPKRAVEQVGRSRRDRQRGTGGAHAHRIIGVGVAHTLRDAGFCHPSAQHAQCGAEEARHGFGDAARASAGG